MKIYEIGMYKRNHGKTIVVQAVTNKDYLNCEIIEYYGQRETTKARLRAFKNLLLVELQKLPAFKDAKYIVIE